MLFEDTYKTIENISEGLFKDRGSKFIAHAIPVNNESQVKEHLSALRKIYHDARHHCYAYQLGFDKSSYRINDDGEPSGTAGKPIFGQILSHNLTNILIVVVRYFGGTKLGVGGLINAYKTSAKDALNNAKIIKKTINEVYEIIYDYPVMNAVKKIIKEENITQVSQKFDLNCKIKFLIRKSNSSRIYEKFMKIKGLKINYLHTE
ncbi:MAG: YigZ family protein [Bacteroidales bacterium]|nr:YigZ family protein [Bacteroidales bacterium]